MRASLACVVVSLAVLWIGSIVMYPDLPPRVPLHFNFAGEPDRWGQRSPTMWFLIPVVATAVAALMFALGRWSTRRPDLMNFPGKEDLIALPPEHRGPAIRQLVAMTDWIGLCVVVCLLIVQYAIYAAALGRDSAGLIPFSVLIGCIGPLAAILIQSARIGRAVSEARATLRSILLAVAAAGSVMATSACSRDSGRPRDPVRVAAAADLLVAFETMGARFEQVTGHRVVFSYGSTGLLAKQLREGAPFDVFAAANIAFAEEVADAGVCDRETIAIYARGRIALWSRDGSAAPPGSLDELADRRFRRIAIANPEHAPYGLAAQQALRSVGIWDSIVPRLVYGDNIRQALQFAETGNADVAIVALPLVSHDSANPWIPISETLHAPIDQALVVCAGGRRRTEGAAFADFVVSDAGRQVLLAHGFAAPREPLADSR
jgi:molybdate transport system substrate-binding protein